MTEDWLSQPDTYSLIKSHIEPALSLCYFYRLRLNRMKLLYRHSRMRPNKRSIEAKVKSPLVEPVSLKTCLERSRRKGGKPLYPTAEAGGLYGLASKLDSHKSYLFGDRGAVQ
jgi:hypothetical protein